MKFIVANEDLADQIKECTNDAFLADTFFKKSEYHQRFTINDVKEMINAKDSIFLALFDKTISDEIIGSIYLHWIITSNLIDGENYIEVSKHSSA